MDLADLAVQEENLVAQEFLAVLDHLDLVDHLDQEENPESLDLREHLVNLFRSTGIDFMQSKSHDFFHCPRIYPNLSNFFIVNSN